MATTVEAIEAEIAAGSVPGFRGRLIARGQARAMIWRDGVLPPGAPAFSDLLSYDLHSYGYAMLGQGLRLRDLGGRADRARLAFEQAGTALESVIAKGDPADPDRDFHHVMAAAAYHLGRFSARAYSLLVPVQSDDNFSPLERALCHLILRNFRELEELVVTDRLGGAGSDASIRALFEQEDSGRLQDQPPDDDGGSPLFEGIDLALTDNFFAALAVFLFALERGASSLVDRSRAMLQTGLSACADLNLLPQWWSHRVAIHLIDDLWSSSFHERLPRVPDGGDPVNWGPLRETFIALLLCKERAEIDLWPSQLPAAARAANQSDDLVVSLPTSAGKTRIAELCILRCLAAQRRVIFVTPLRALSAQTEVSLQRIFGPLGKKISTLYGSIGISGFDEDVLREADIVVATPEKLDFALRNDPSLIDDVGLLVFDEGHMIGLGEREVRYEVQIQRLLKRPDAAERRIVCLSAVLSDGEQLEDFANWLRRDQPGEFIKDDWRPTRVRYGEVVWSGDSARLNLRVGDERPFVPRFLTAVVPPIGKRTTPFPKDLGELCLATAWRLVEDGQSVLIFCPVRSHVEPFADRIMDLHKRGALASLLHADPAVLGTALALGEEWLGPDNPILRCLRLGVAIHHGALPTPYRKEIERLLRDGVLKVTISSPTLAQGLNLSATAVIFHSLSRNRQQISDSEFRNVVGRAGRAFVDVEGLVLYPIFDQHAWRLSHWEKLIQAAGARELESGLVQLVVALLSRMYRKLGRPPLDQLIEYVLNNAAAWEFPELAGEAAEQQEHERSVWRNYLAWLDTAILSLLGEQEIAEADIPAALDEILASSLWERRLTRHTAEGRQAIKSGLLGRAKHLWANSTAPQRRGYFLAGVGLTTGSALDQIAPSVNELLVDANAAILNHEDAAAIQALTTLADKLFAIPPFIPDDLPANWQDILRLWLQGLPVGPAIAGHGAEGLQFVEGGLVYRLPWGMEAIRVRSIANRDIVESLGVPLDFFELRLAVAAVETGTLNRPAAILIQAGFSSRRGAIKAVQDTEAEFSSAAELRLWLDSPEVSALTDRGNWPTPETAEMWRSFRASFSPVASRAWSDHRFTAQVAWRNGKSPPGGQPVRLYSHPESGAALVLSESAELLGQLRAPLNPLRKGLARVSVLEHRPGVLISYLGPSDLWTR
jgi:superfamily II DNA/RNA helicase